MVVSMIQMFVLTMMILLAVAFFSLLERKLLSITQYRKGPNKVFVTGMFQPLSDAIKLISKATYSPNLSSSIVYVISPMIMVSIAVVIWVLVPFSVMIIHVKESGVIVLVILSLSALPAIFSGWFSNSMYSMIGAIRSIAQTVSFEISLSFTLFIYYLVIQSFNLIMFNLFQKWMWLLIVMPWMLVMLMILFLAEGGRSPFDLPEGESELVSGYTIEYGGIHYTLIFLSENLAVLFMATIISHINMGGVSLCKVAVVVVIIVLIRSSFPRIRYDHLMELNWVKMLPILISMVWVISILN